MIGTNLREPKEKVCLGCYKKLDGQGVVCPGCNWPMCGKQRCWGKESDHALGECSLLKGFQERIQSKDLDLLELPDLYMSITVLRVLALRNRDPVKWEKLMKIKHCVSSLRLSELKSGIQVKIVKLVNDSLLAVAVPEEWIFKIYLAFALNCFELTESQVK